jgi:hypothetical protein
MNKIIAYKLSNGPLDIRPAPMQRDWIDATPKRYGYHCTPLTIANQHGWEILCPATFEATWNGGKIEFPGGECPYFIEPHEHIGALGFNIEVLFRTDPGINFLIGGPINRLKDGCHALTVIVETDHAVTSIMQMVWKFTSRMSRFVSRRGSHFALSSPLAGDWWTRQNLRYVTSKTTVQIRF